MRRGRAARGTPRAGGSQGFLLAEALVTMAIGAFLLVALVSLVHLLTRADARTADLSRRVEAESRALDAIGRDLRPVVRARWGGAGTPFVFAGTNRRMQFAVRDPAVGDIRFVTLQAGDGRVLRTDAALPPFAGGPADLGPGATSDLYAGPSNVRFAYFQRLGAGQEALTDTWTAPLDMPSAVRIALIDPATGAITSSVRFPLMVDAEPGCAAPRRGVCSYVETGEADAIDDADLPPEAVEASDPLGWLRYAR